MNIEKYGFHYEMMGVHAFENTIGIPARITAVHRELFECISEKGECKARLKASEYRDDEEAIPTTGDFVLLDWQEQGESRILKTLQRKTFFSRRDPSSSGNGEQIVAANFDYVFIMQSLNHNFNFRRLERYLTLAWQSDAVPVIILTKADLQEDNSPQLSAVKNLAVGVDVFAISSITGDGIHSLSKYLLSGKTIVFLGSSGVGKSTLVNTLAGEKIMATREIRDDDSRGRHATTHRQLIMLPNGVMIIDTPGMRELGMWDVSEGLGQSFSDVEAYLGTCKFNNCTHQNEPGCAIKIALCNGELSSERWESYLKLKNEARYTDDKTEYLRDKEKWQKEITRKIKDWQKSDRF
ncbi:MAG: ribosome small subunit-dependent GTPase A [Treponema sp.]|jgi:ribosome biogenesis GTPase|nr:ribosome small subunit-dependent GTPase A [Treponema sp.]